MEEQVVEIALDAIEDDDTYRFRLWLDVSDLAADIGANGQDFPVVVRPRGQRYQLVCGFRRMTALRQLGAETVRAVVRELDDDEALRLAWSENESRASYSELERAHAVLKASLAGYALRDLEELFGLKKTALGNLRKLATLPAVLQAAVESGKLTTEKAVTLNAMKQTYPDLEFERWVDRVAEEGWSLRAMKQRIGLAYDAPRRPVAVQDRKSGRVRLRARQFVPAELGAEERELLIVELKMVLALLEGDEDA